MKKASKLFSGFMSKGKAMFNQKKEASQPTQKDEFDGFDSGEDDDLIEIGKDKGTTLGAKSMLVNLESLTSESIMNEEKYANKFKSIEAGKSSGPKTEFDIIKEAIERCL